MDTLLIFNCSLFYQKGMSACVPDPCKPFGSCVTLDSHSVLFTCVCSSNIFFSGKYCEIRNYDNCEFTAGSYCNWTRNENLAYKWATRKGGTPSSLTGPSADHTTGLDYYIYAEASSAGLNAKAVLTSRQFSRSSQCRCITWYYHMYGRYMGELGLYVKDIGGSRKKLWSKRGNQGNKWISGDVTISDVASTNYQVEFEAICGSSYESDIALDDIYIYEMPCGVQRIGCFNERLSSRALPDLIANLRSKIDWSDLQKTVRECACIAHDKGYKYFAVQFYGECWGSRSLVEYDKYGPSKYCWPGVGQNSTNFVYKFMHD